ncbi:MAG: hypothetical protein PVG39_01430 [Desulfobacteraceae bacterium]|jgi:hypothetical protein
MENYLERVFYRRQIGNELREAISCNTTHMIMNFFEAGWRDEVWEAMNRWNRESKNKFTQPEDAMTHFSLQEKYRKDASDRLGPAYYDYPAEVWQTLRDIANDFIGLDIVRIEWTITLDRIADHLSGGEGVGVSGKFPRTDGHFVNVGNVGKDLILINDPLGNHKTNYAPGSSGYGVEMDIPEFRRIIKCANKRKYQGTFLAYIVQAKG